MKSKGLGLLASLCLMTLTACTMMTGLRETEGHAFFCQVAEPISWSSKDTGITILQVKQHNAVGKELCGWRADGG